MEEKNKMDAKDSKTGMEEENGDFLYQDLQNYNDLIKKFVKGTALVFGTKQFPEHKDEMLLMGGFNLGFAMALSGQTLTGLHTKYVREAFTEAGIDIMDVSVNG